MTRSTRPARTIGTGAGVISLLALGAAAADLPPHQSLLPASCVEQIAPGGNARARTEIAAVSGMPFGKAVRITNLQRMSNFWE